MKREAQSLWDLLAIPLPNLTQRGGMVSEREARALYDIFKSERDEHGEIILPDSIDTLVVAALTTKGYLKNNPSRMVVGRMPLRTVSFTDKARGLIRNLILFTEKSAFDKKMDPMGDRESFIRAITGLPFAKKASATKTASRSDDTPGDSWLKRAVNQWNSH